MTRRLIVPILVIILISVSLIPTDRSHAQAGTAYDMIAAVNALRAGYGLGPLQIDPILMSIAQAHSDYQASIQTVTHTGAGGTSVRDRAAAAGFGGGASFFVSENIAGGTNLSVQTAIYDYWQDALHMNTMIGEYTYIGAGVGFSGDKVYYTVDVGYYSGAPTPEAVEAATPVPGATQTSGTPQPTPIVFDPFIISTPRDDGAIIHIVGYGQTLIGIAQTYEISLSDLLEQNYLTTDSVIYPGENLIIKPSETAGLESSIPLTGTLQVTISAGLTTTLSLTNTTNTTDTFGISSANLEVADTPTPTRTPSPAPTQTQHQESTPAAPKEQDAAFLSSGILQNNKLLTYTAIGLAIIVLVAVLISGFTQSKGELPRPDNSRDNET